MEPLYGVALARQYDAVIAMLDQALVACPAALWTERLWPTLPPAHFPPPFAEFWYVCFHALVWLDLYLLGIPEESFAPPPFAQGEIDSVATLPDRPYARDALGIVPAFVRQAITGRWRPVATRAELPAIRVSMIALANAWSTESAEGDCLPRCKEPGAVACPCEVSAPTVHDTA